MSEQDTAEFPLPADTTDTERAQAKREIGKHAEIVAEEPRLIKLKGRLLGQTGPNWHFQYTRIYALPKGFLAAGHDIREGIKVSYADDLRVLGDLALRLRALFVGRVGGQREFGGVLFAHRRR